MIRFISLTMRNFMSYGNNTTTVEFQDGTTLISGQNGKGKTVIINALAYAVYGKPISDINLDNLVNNINKKNMEVTVLFEENGTYHYIQRVRKAKATAAGNYVRYYKREGDANFTDVDEETRDKASTTNKVIQRAIGIPHELFCRIVVFSAIHTPFLDLPVRHPTQICQTKIIEELFDLTSLTEKAEALKQQIKGNETQLELKQNDVEHREREHERHRQQVASAEKRVVNWEQQNREQIAELEDKLEKVAGVNLPAQQKHHERLAEIGRTWQEISSAEVETKRFITRLESDIAKREKELEHLKEDKCPRCLQQYPNADAEVRKISEEVVEKNGDLEAYKIEHEDLFRDLVELQNEKEKVQSKIRYQDLDELISIRNQASTIKGRIKELEKAVNPFIEPLEELQDMKLDPINIEEVNELVRVIEHQKLLYKLLTKKDSFVRKALLDKNIPFMNKRLQQYLNDIDLPHTVEFTHELTAQISQFGRPLDFGNLSNGQRARINLALSLAFRDVLQNLHKKINVCMFDEVLDVGLDTIGVQAAGRMLKRKARDEKVSLYIISHRDEINSAFDHSMIIDMQNGFSFIQEE